MLSKGIFSVGLPLIHMEGGGELSGSWLGALLIDPLSACVCVCVITVSYN